MDLKLKTTRPNLLKEADREYFQSFCSSPRHNHGMQDADVDWQERHDQAPGPEASPTGETRVGPWWSRLAPSSGMHSPTNPASPARRNCLTPSTSLCGALPATQPPSTLRARIEAGHMQEVMKDLLDAKRAASGGADTPADLLLSMLADMLLGLQPDLSDVALARSLLLRHADPYQPLNLRRQMREANLDADVVHALMHQLGASTATDPGASRSRCSSDSAGSGRDDGGVAPEDTTAKQRREQEEEEEEALTACEAAMLAAGAGSLRDALAVLLGLVALSPGSRPTGPARESDAGAGGGASTTGGGSALGNGANGSVSSGCGGGGGEEEIALRRQGRRMSVPPPILDEVERVLALSDAWQYDTWLLAEVTQGHALSCLAFHLLHREGLVSQFRIQPNKLARLLRTLESGYPSNPYHNSTHAADVLQTFHVLLRGAGLTSHYLDRLGLLAAYMAAVVHDHGHPGLTADFLIATSNPLAVRYNDRSPLENHHGASFFELLQQPGMDALSHLPHAEKAAFRKLVLDLVMATDMKQHFSLLAHFNTAHHLTPYNKDAGPWALARGGVRLDRRSRGAPEPSGSDPAAPADEATGPVPSFREDRPHPRPHDETERTLSLQIALKVADLGHLGEELEVHKRWVRSLEEEFFRQGDREQQMGLPISPLFDRAKQGVSKSQVGFYDFIALPLVHALTSAFPGARPLLACFVDNYDHWRAAEKAAAEKAAHPHPHPHPHKQHSQHVMRVLEQQAQPASGASDATQ